MKTYTKLSNSQQAFINWAWGAFPFSNIARCNYVSMWIRGKKQTFQSAPKKQPTKATLQALIRDGWLEAIPATYGLGVRLTASACRELSGIEREYEKHDPMRYWSVHTAEWHKWLKAKEGSTS